MAAPGDLAPRDTGLRFNPSGAIVEVDPYEEERLQREAEARERLHQQKLELRKYEAEQMRLAEEARRAAFNAEVPNDYFRV
jgi:hypothetical protein